MLDIMLFYTVTSDQCAMLHKILLSTVTQVQYVMLDNMLLCTVTLKSSEQCYSIKNRNLSLVCNALRIL